MKLGPYLRKKYTAVHEFARRSSTFIDYGLWLLVDPSKYHSVKQKEIDSILVVLVNEESGNVGGDFCILGVMNHFKKVYPEIRLGILSDSNTLKRFGKVPGIDTFEYKSRETLESLKEENFKAALFINIGDLKAKDFMFIPYRVAPFYPSIKGVINFKYKLFYTRKAFIPWGTHMIDICFKMFETLGFKFKEKDPGFYFSKEEEARVKNFLKKNKIKKFIIIHPGGKFVVETLRKGKWPPHLWPLERYAEVADYFSEKGHKVIITGTKEEEYLSKKINDASKKGVINCCGKFTIRELGALLKESKLLVSTDTAVVHIAYQIKTPIIELMGPSCPEVVGAWPLHSKKNKILFDNGPCARSMKKQECPEDIICLGNIKTDEVIKESEKLLKKFT